MIEAVAPKIVHIHFHCKVGYVEFLNEILGPDCILTEQTACDRYSTFMGMQIEAYTFGGKTIYFAADLFSAIEAERFEIFYNIENFTGTCVLLQRRKELRYEAYVHGRILLAIGTAAARDGVLEVDFTSDGPQCLPFLHTARMQYTAPTPGNFTSACVHIDPSKPSILFYV